MTVDPEDVWICDRNFCTNGFLCEIINSKSNFIIREQGKKILLRRMTLLLMGETRDGDKEINVLSSLPKRISAKKIVKLYRD